MLTRATASRGLAFRDLTVFIETLETTIMYRVAASSINFSDHSKMPDCRHVYYYYSGSP